MNSRPGRSRPLAWTSSGSTGNVPVSEARMTQPSVVTIHRPGRSPLRSRVAPMTCPSVNETEAGPSHGSIRQEWYWKNPLTSSVRSSRPALPGDE